MIAPSFLVDMFAFWCDTQRVVYLENAMEFVKDLSEYNRLIPLFQEQIGSYYVSGMMSYWDLIAGSPVRQTPTSVELSEDFFSWSRVPESLREAVANYYLDYAPGYPLSAEPKDLQYFFWGNEFRLHMWNDVTGNKKNPAVNGMTLAGWTPLRNWLISEMPEEAALLGSLLHERSSRGDHELTDPLEYLKSLIASSDTYLLAGYALWRLQRLVGEFDLEEEHEAPSFGYEFGW